MPRYLLCTNELLDRIDFASIAKITMWDDIKLLCSYGLDIEYLSGTKDRYLYYEKWARNKDYKRLFYFKKKERNYDHK
jgi:hypothetical protein